jgi:hypothetical protein
MSLDSRTGSVESRTASVDFRAGSMDSRSASVSFRTASVDSGTASVSFRTGSMESRTASMGFGRSFRPEIRAHPRSLGLECRPAPYQTLAGTFAFASSFLPRPSPPANPSAPASLTTRGLNSANSPEPTPSRTGTAAGVLQACCSGDAMGMQRGYYGVVPMITP